MSRKIAVLSLLLASSLAWSQGDVLDMGVAKDRFEAPGKPTRGMTQDRVRSTYGEPRTRESAVGDPPISRWHYDGFVVYFEYDKVIHSVSKG